MKVVGVILMIAGVALGLWAGVWWAFVGGVVSVVHGFSATPFDAMAIALGFLRMIFAAFIGWISFFVVSGSGLAIYSATK